MHGISAILLVVQIVVINGSVNYCGVKMCGHSNAHTFCKYPPGPSASCSGYMAATLSKEEKMRIVARLNRRRSEGARSLRRWPPAGDMLKLRWMEELSREAQRWADQCRPPQSPEERDVCRDLYSISVGQCVASIVGEAPGLRPETMVDMWYMQSRVYDGNVTAYTPSHSKIFYGDFAQMMWSRTFLVGCGRSRFMAEWRGRLRTVERLVCNFAPRGPVPFRPLWSPAHPASMCPPRAHPDTLSGLCAYQNIFDESRNQNDSLSVHDDFFLNTVFEIEKNESLDYLGSLDELYLTKIAIATIRTTIPMIPLYYSLQKRDVLAPNGEDEHFLKVDNGSKVENNSIASQHIMPEEKTTRRTKHYKTKVYVIGRPKPYDINELNDASPHEKFENFNDIQVLTSNKEKDLYVEYGLVDPEEDIVNITTPVGELALTIHTENPNNVELKTEQNGFTEVIKTTESMFGSESYFNNSNEETNASIINERSVEDYLSDPETVKALQDALARMEETLASSEPVSTSGKVRRELRNLEADLQNIRTTEIGTVTRALTNEMKTDEAVKTGEWNKSKDKGPMLSMVLKYMPYLKPYESSIVGEPNNHCDKVYLASSIFICSLALHAFV